MNPQFDLFGLEFVHSHAFSVRCCVIFLFAEFSLSICARIFYVLCVVLFRQFNYSYNDLKRAKKGSLTLSACLCVCAVYS